MLDRSLFKYRDHSSVLLHCRDVMVEEDCVQNLHQEENYSLWEMLQGHVRVTVRARSIADLETPDGLLKRLRAC